MNRFVTRMNRLLKMSITNLISLPFFDKIFVFVGGAKLHAELYVRSSQKKLLADAKKKYEKGSSFGDLNDYKQALEKHWVSYSEYAYQYEFFKKTEREREEYISQLKMAYFYLRYAPGNGRRLFRKKQTFLKYFNQYVHRQWLYAPNSTYNEFKQFITNDDCIIKPCDGTRGKGVYKIFKNEVNNNNCKKIFESCVKNRMIVEQCIDSCEELKAFHPQSLNTIRVVTIANKEKACVFSGVLRTGVGDSVIDNSHKGGVSVQINVQNGIVETNGVNTNGERFISHPDSGIIFKGFRIPKWDAIVETCCEAAKLTENPITGWDVAINKLGDIEFVEANHTPDLDMMQARYDSGIKKRLCFLIKEYCDIEIK